MALFFALHKTSKVGLFVFSHSLFTLLNVDEKETGQC